MQSKPSFSSSSALIISENPQKILSKEQRTFNRLTREVERFQQLIKNTAKNLDECLVFYGSRIHPLEKQTTAIRKEIVKSLYYSFYSEKGILSAEQKKFLKKALIMQLEEIFFVDPVQGEEVKALFKNLKGVSYEEEAGNEFDEMKNEMEELFAEQGLDMDFSDLKFNSGPEEMIKKMMEIKEEMKKKEDEKQQKQAKRKKTKKQIEKEERENAKEALRRQSISSIYKQLAKILHPDLEQDEAIKLEKEEMMKQLTAAYEANDLPALLRLELQWIHKENNQLDTLSETKLNIYNELLKEQVHSLKTEVSMLGHSMKYQSLERFSGGMHGNFPCSIRVLQREEDRLKSIHVQMEESFRILKSEKALSEVLEIIYAFKEEEKLAKIIGLGDLMNFR